MERVARYGFGLAALSVIGTLFLSAGGAPVEPAKIRADVSASIEERIGTPWQVRRLRILMTPASGTLGPFLIDAEVELGEATFSRLERVNGIVIGDRLGSPGFKKHLQGKLWLDQSAATTFARIDIDNVETLSGMGTPQSKIAGRILVRGSSEAQQWISASALEASSPGATSWCSGACLSDRLGEIKHDEDGNRREQKAKRKGADESEASSAPEESNEHGKQ
jgi:hypothetical protein